MDLLKFKSSKDLFDVVLKRAAGMGGASAF